MFSLRATLFRPGTKEKQTFDVGYKMIQPTFLYKICLIMGFSFYKKQCRKDVKMGLEQTVNKYQKTKH